MRYNHKKIEKTWQKIWEKHKLYAAKNSDSSARPRASQKPKYYSLVEFPYPSGDGLHVGHVRSYTAMDIISRKRRMQGYNVLYPIGWDAFGLPTENYAIKTGIAPAIVTKKNTDIFRKQLKSLGLSFDWNREINTTDPEYYKWTQWLFLQFFKHGLAYKASVPINWCPKDKIGLANEEVIGGKCERCGTPVEQRQKEQWMLKITAYADKLLAGLKDLDFLPEIKKQQENWIGKSEGAEIEFPIVSNNNYVLLHGFTGRPDKNFFPWLKQSLEKRGHKVFAPQLPNTDNPTEAEQVAYILENAEFDENTILFAHSLGSAVALKVLEKLEKPIAGLVLAGGFIDIKRRELLKQNPRPYDTAFSWDFNFGIIKKNCGFIKILAAKNDSSIPLETSLRLKAALDGDYQEVMANGDHFTALQEPIILQALAPAVKVFTTRPDTIFGATFLAISPEHGFIKNNESKIKNYAAVSGFINKCRREPESKEKNGIELKGVTAINPASSKEIPIWIVNYVLGDVGTGAIMAVPAHDERDWGFAKKYKLPITMVVCPHYPAKTCPVLDNAYTGDGHLVGSGRFDGMDSETAKWEIVKAVNGEKETRYKLRDWVFSRQRYWGEPIPLIFCDNCHKKLKGISNSSGKAGSPPAGRAGVPAGQFPIFKHNKSEFSKGELLNPGWFAVRDENLPVKLPSLKNYQPRDDGQSPLASAKKWVNVKCPNCNGSAKRETDVMPNWAGSSWYFLASVGNGGRLYRPFIKKDTAPEILFDYSDWSAAVELVQRGLRDAVAQPYGSSHILADLPIKVAGKTGTPQTANNVRLNAFFAGYGPVDDPAGPQIAILVFVENAREGSLNALPIAKDVFRWYYENRLRPAKTANN